MHPKSNAKWFKSFIFNNKITVIFAGFIILYLILSVIFIGLYFLLIDTLSLSLVEIAKFSFLSSFDFDIDKSIADTNTFFVVNTLHQIIALILSTIFTAAIVLKFFYLPTFFVFKKKCNYIEKEGELVISLYNSIDIFVTNCNVKVYGRQRIVRNGTASLENINDKKPIFQSVYPFMETYLATRLKIPVNQNDTKELWNILEDKIEDQYFELIILIEANASKLDSSVYEVYRYIIDSNNIEKTVDFYKYKDLDLDYNDFSKCEGWKEFDK